MEKSTASKIKKCELNGLNFSKKLPIPSHFQHILDTFVSLDIIVNKLVKKREVLYISRISEIFLEMNEKIFDKEIFGQILAVFPESYCYEFEKPPMKITRHYKEKIKVIPNFSFGLEADSVHKRTNKNLTPSQLIFRSNRLYERLVNLVVEKHNDFLINLNQLNGNSLEDSSTLVGWHSEFDIESKVEKISSKTLENSENINTKSPLKKSVNKPTTTRSSLADKSNDLEFMKETGVELLKKDNIKPKVTFSRYQSNNENKPMIPIKNKNISCKISPKSDLKKLATTPEVVKCKAGTPVKATEERTPNKATNQSRVSFFSKRSPQDKSQKMGTPVKPANEKTPNKAVNQSRMSFSLNSSLEKSPRDKSQKSRTPGKTDEEKTPNKIMNQSRISFVPKVFNNTSSKDKVTANDTTLGSGRKSQEGRQNIIKPRMSFAMSNSSDTTRSDGMKTPDIGKLTRKDEGSQSKKVMNQSRLSFGLNESHKSSPRVDAALPGSTLEFLQKQKLPFHLKTLYELFKSLDKVVRDISGKGEICYMSRVSPTVSMSINFNEIYLGKIMAIYPGSFTVKWERVLTKSSNKPTKKFDLVIRSDLDNDGTTSASISEGKQCVTFDFRRLKERSRIFINNCTNLVNASYTNFLINELRISPDKVLEYLNKTCWSSEFKVDQHVEHVKPIQIPTKPEVEEEAKVDVRFSQFFTLVKARNSELLKEKLKDTPVEKTNDKYNSVSQKLMGMIREKKAKKSVFSQMSSVAVTKQLIISKLPTFLNVLNNEFKMKSATTLKKSHVKNIICKCLGIQENLFEEFVKVFIELVPGWITVHEWDTPYYSICDSQMNFDEVKNKLDQMIIANR